MAYSNTAATLRADVQTVVLEAAQADNMFIGDRVFPVYQSQEKTGQFPKFKLATGQLLNDAAVARAETGTYNEVIRAFETDNFSCVDRGLEERVDDAFARDYERFFDAEVLAAKHVYRQVRLGHERRVSSALFNTSNFTATAAAVDYTAANLATIAFHRDVLGAAERLAAKGTMANSVVMSFQVFNRIRQSTLAQNYIRGAGKSTDATLMLTAQDLAGSLQDIGIKQVLVGALNYNSAKQGQAYSATAIWGNTYFWVGDIQSGDFMSGGAGRTIVWNKEGGLFVTETYRDEKRRSDMIRVRQHTAEKVIDPTCGELITTSYS